MHRVRNLFLLAAMVIGVTIIPRAVSANIILELRPANQVTVVGGHPNLGLYAVSDNLSNQLMSAADVLMVLDPNYLALTGVDQTGAAPSLFSGFPNSDPWGNINQGTFDTASSQYWYYSVLAGFGSPIAATPLGTLLTTFQLDALAPTPLLSPTVFSILLNAGNGGKTTVYDGTTPNLDVTGSLGHANITIVPEPATISLLLLGTLAFGYRGRVRRA